MGGGPCLDGQHFFQAWEKNHKIKIYEPTESVHLTVGLALPKNEGGWRQKGFGAKWKKQRGGVKLV